MIQVMYECKVCKVKATVEVAIRETKMNVVDWMEWAVQPTIGRDHRTRSPFCGSEHLDVKIRLEPGSSYVGGPSVN